MVAIAGELIGVFATDRRQHNRWRRDARLKVSTELLSSLQEVIRGMIHLAYLTEKPPQPALTPAASAYHEASVKWNSPIYAAMLVSSHPQAIEGGLIQVGTLQPADQFQPRSLISPPPCHRAMRCSSCSALVPVCARAKRSASRSTASTRRPGA